ncbi:flagellar export chaperone FlgN [Shimia marina]|uniref:FlgN protein n=1 Tax=Shimia marina TaxID=321267 RepID=A0A0N7LRP2_9RHOB|nr:flagellar export chaperone FlgN [Shimia marina]CUH51372.1 FlgN protein [Shimia marina]SFD50770.1 FlgN protein [Shimia marina]
MSEEIEITLLDSLETLLEEERQALLKGDLEALPDLLERKESLFEDLEAQHEEIPLEAEALEPLQHLFVRNQSLLESSQNGLRATTERMGTLRRVRTSLETYNNNGQRQAVQLTSGQRVEKRA